MRYFLLAGWASLPNNSFFFPKLAKDLTEMGHTVIFAEKPCADGDIPKHIKNLEELVDKNGGLGSDCVFVGQSIGQAVALRYLASRPADQDVVVGGVVAAGGWTKIPRAMQLYVRVRSPIVPLQPLSSAPLPHTLLSGRWVRQRSPHGSSHTRLTSSSV